MQDVDLLYATMLYTGFLIVVVLIFRFKSTLALAHCNWENPSTVRHFKPVSYYSSLTLVQYRINASAMMIVGGRFHGLTSKPQMFVISVAPFFAVSHFVFSSAKKTYVKIISVVVTVVGLYWCYLNGSRLALVLVFYSVCCNDDESP